MVTRAIFYGTDCRLLHRAHSHHHGDEWYRATHRNASDSWYYLKEDEIIVLKIEIGTCHVGNVGEHPAMFIVDELGRMIANQPTTLRWVRGLNAFNIGARPESGEFVRACERDEAIGLIENRKPSEKHMDQYWLTDFGRSLLMSAE